MADQSAVLTQTFQAIGTDIKALLTGQGNLSNLNTTQKGNLVAALNEVRAMVTTAGAQINDSTASTSTVYSSSKTESTITAMVDGAIADLVDGAPAAYDTLKEIADYIAADETATQGLLTAVNNRVKFNEPQSLTETEQIQASQNIGVGDPTTDFVSIYEAAKA